MSASNETPRSRRATPSFASARPEFSFTREGRVYVLVTIGVGLGAVNTGNNLLYLVLGLLLGLFLTSGILSEIVLRGVEIRRRPPPRLFASRHALMELEVQNHKRAFASTSFEVLDAVDGEKDGASAYLTKLEAGKSTRVVVERTPASRGTLRFTHLRVRTRFPFGLLQKTRTVRVPTEAIVFPALVPVELPRIARAEHGHERSGTRPGPASEVIGLREHRSGDSLRDIHWRRTASLGRPVSRERASPADPLLRLTLPLRVVGADEGRARFERSVSEVASMAVASIDAGRPVEVRTETSLLARADDRAALDRLLRELALVEPLVAEDDGVAP